MPKVIVLFFGAESPTETLAEAAAEGAKGVRFTEVDLRSGTTRQATAIPRHKRLESPSQVRDYDGVVLACAAAGDIPSDLSALLDEWEQSSSDALRDTVFGITGGLDTALPGRVARLGGILVAGATGVADPEVRAMRIGARVATVAFPPAARAVDWRRKSESIAHLAPRGPTRWLVERPRRRRAP